MEVNGTLMNYYFHCKRQCWLHANRINLEGNSEDVSIGKAMHELRLSKSELGELTIDNIKIDKITDEYLVEIKKSDADIEATRWQLLYYLSKLKEKGIVRKGKIEVIEKKKGGRKIYYETLTAEKEKELEKYINLIRVLKELDKPPIIEKTNKCKRCSYYEFCFI